MRARPLAAITLGVAIGSLSLGAARAQPCVTSIDCDDSDPCTQDVCDASACSHPPAFGDGAGTAVRTLPNAWLRAVAVRGDLIFAAESTAVPPRIVTFTQDAAGLSAPVTHMVNQQANGLGIMPDGDLAVLDGNTLLVYDASGSHIDNVTFIGSSGVALAVDDLGFLYALRANGTVSVYDDNLTHVQTIEPVVASPTAIAWADHVLYVLDGTARRIGRVGERGGPVTYFLSPHLTGLSPPHGIAAVDDEIWVLGGSDTRLLKLDELGNLLGSFEVPQVRASALAIDGGFVFLTGGEPFTPNAAIARTHRTLPCGEGDACSPSYCSAAGTCEASEAPCATGSCEVVAGVATCECPPTHLGLDCGLACPTSAGEVCGARGSCSEVWGAAVCTCAAGAFGSACGELCPGVTEAGTDTFECGNGPGGHRGVCNDGAAGNGQCTCDDGWYLGTGASSGNGPCTRSRCGDGIVVGAETCDDADMDTGDACPSGPTGSCVAAICGDGFLRTDVLGGAPGYEACDTGALRSDTEPDACRTTCTLPSCGDGVTDTGEECDGSAECTGACVLVATPLDGGTPDSGAPDGSVAPYDAGETPEDAAPHDAADATDATDAADSGVPSANEGCSCRAGVARTGMSPSALLVLALLGWLGRKRFRGASTLRLARPAR